MGAQDGTGTGSRPSADEPLAPCREHFRASDVAALTDLYHPEAGKLDGDSLAQR